MLNFCSFTKDFLDQSWEWLNDPEIKKLTMTPDFSREDQLKFYYEIANQKNYNIYGICFGDEKIGVCGLKNISISSGEYWGYIGKKNYWGRGLGKEIITFIEVLACKLRLKMLYLRVGKENLRAISLYEKNGFIIKESFESYFVMEKSI